MESKFQTSFIPKRSLDEKGGARVKTPISILFIVGMILILLAIGVSAGAYFYKTLLTKRIADKQVQLQSEQGNIDSDGVANIVRIDNKMKIAGNLLNSHVAVSKVFSLLSDATLKNLRFTSFAFSYLANNKVAITMQGQAKSFEVVAKQAEAFASSTVAGGDFKDSIFSDLNLDDKGNVSFSFLSSFDPNVILYKDNVASSTVASTPQ